MSDISMAELSRLTGCTRETVMRRVDGLPWKPGPDNAHLYDSKQALRAIYFRDNLGVPPQDALALTRKEQIELDMETTRRERIPLEDVEEHNEAVLQNIAGILKASEGKKLTPELIQEIFAELRRMDEILRDYSRKAQQPEEVETRDPEPENWEKDPMLE